MNRNSSIELLKIFAIYLIVVCHSVMSLNLNLGFSTNNIQIFILNFLKYFGSYGNIIFIICSVYFMAENTKYNTKKIFKMWLQAYIISIIFLSIFLVFGVNVSLKNVIKSLAPLTFENNWFILCYIMLYALHPYLNLIISKMNKKTHFRICIVSIILYSFIQFVLKNRFYFNNIIGFVYIYFIIAYMKKYMHKYQNNIKINLYVLIISIFLMLGILALTNYIGLYYSFFGNKMLYYENLGNPLILLTCISLFNVFHSFDFKNQLINKISSVSLFIYIIHENLLFREYIRPTLISNFYSLTKNYLVCVLIFSLILFIVSTLLSLVYRWCENRFINKFYDFIFDKAKKVYIRMENALLIIFNSLV